MEIQSIGGELASLPFEQRLCTDGGQDVTQGPDPHSFYVASHRPGLGGVHVRVIDPLAS